MARIDPAEIMRMVSKDTGLTNAKLKASAKERMMVAFNDGVIGMKKEFEEDKVTQEIDGGVAASNISNTLGGGTAPDNLFSFIGFKEGDNPTEVIRRSLEPSSPDGPKLGPLDKIPDNVPHYRAIISAPNLDKIYAKTPLPWGEAEGMSWAEKIETHIPGYAKFLARFTKSDVSRSGGGVQVKADLHPDTFTPPANGYLTRIFKNFVKTVKGSSSRQRFR
jgi:hypothetical protein